MSLVIGVILIISSAVMAIGVMIAEIEGFQFERFIEKHYIKK